MFLYRIRDTFQAGLFQADTAQRELKKLQEETGMFGSISDEEINNNVGKTYQDLTALRDPLIGLGYDVPTDEEPRPFDGAAQDAAVTDYNPYRDPQTGRYTSGPTKSSTGRGKRDKLRMSKAERRKVSSGILTDHPNLKQGEKSGYFFDKYYYGFVVNAPGSYHFIQRIPIVGNEKMLRKLSGEK